MMKINIKEIVNAALSKVLLDKCMKDKIRMLIINEYESKLKNEFPMTIYDVDKKQKTDKERWDDLVKSLTRILTTRKK